MQTIIKTIKGKSSKVYAVKNHRRIFIADAVPKIEVYENNREVDGARGVKSFNFLLVICSNPELDSRIRSEDLNGVSYFEVNAVIERKDGTFVPFDFLGLARYSIEQFDRWEFEIDCPEITKEMLNF